MAASRAAYLAPLLILLLCAPAFAQSRAIPQDAKHGYVRHLEGMGVSIDGRPMQLAPGARILNRERLSIVPTSLPADGAWAAYVIDDNGQVAQIWLTPAKPGEAPGTAR
jgi:hypothetical protein